MADGVVEEIELRAPPELVWRTVMDPSRFGEWVSIHDSVENVPEGGLRLGSEFDQRMKRVGLGFEVHWEVTEYSPPNLARWAGSGPGGSSAAIVYELEDTPEGTRFVYGNDFELPGGPLGKAASRAFGERAARKETRRSLERLKEIVEAEAKAPR